MKTMVVGSGGREHAMGLVFQGSTELLFTQPNAGMQELGEDLETRSIDEIVETARDRHVDFVAIGPEAPLADGLADKLRELKIPVLGPSRDGAWMEASKIKAYKFNREFGVIQPVAHILDGPTDALRFTEKHDPRTYVIKADGLAGGKGVILPKTEAEARQTVINMMNGSQFGAAGERILIQERLTGPEVSMFAVLDGKKAQVLLLAQDHKRLKDDDEGPNTGGMGAYSPLPESIVSSRQEQKMLDTLAKTLDGLQEKGIDYRGILYIGFMLANEMGGDPAVIEYNVRFGDPEAQVVLTLLDKTTNVHELFYNAAVGELPGSNQIDVVKYAGQSALTVCLAAEGYPNDPRKGDIIHGLDATYEGVTIHHGGTRRAEKYSKQRIETAGGRVLYVTAVGETLDIAAANAYAAIESDNSNGIYFDGMQYRTDIGWQSRTK